MRRQTGLGHSIAALSLRPAYWPDQQQSLQFDWISTVIKIVLQACQPFENDVEDVKPGS